MTMCEEGMNAFRCVMICDCMCMVWLGERDCLCFVCLASFVSVASMTVSVFRNVRVLIVLYVWERVNVCCGLMVYCVLLFVFLLMFLMMGDISSAVSPLTLLSWKMYIVGGGGGGG